MRLPSDEWQEVHREYRYRASGRCFAVYLDVLYRKSGVFPPQLTTIGTKVGTFLSREEARKETYRLNGWKYKEKKV